jgi:hypothetical protein
LCLSVADQLDEDDSGGLTFEELRSNVKNIYKGVHLVRMRVPDLVELSCDACIAESLQQMWPFQASSVCVHSSVSCPSSLSSFSNYCMCAPFGLASAILALALALRLKKTRDDFDVLTENGKHLRKANEFNRNSFHAMMRGELWRHSRRQVCLVHCGRASDCDGIAECGMGHR